MEPAALAQLVAMVGDGQVARLGREGRAGGDGGATAATRRRSSSEKGLGKADEGELGRSWSGRWPSSPTPWPRIRDGNDKAIGAIMGPVMRETKGRADGAEVQRLIRERL